MQVSSTFKKHLGTAQRNFFSRETVLDISAKAQAYKVKLVALVGAKAQFRANQDHTISELEINVCQEAAKLIECKEALDAEETWNDTVRKESFDDESQVNYTILKAAMKVKATEALEEHQALSSLGEKFEASPEHEESRLAEIELLQNEIGEEPKEKKADKAKWKAANRKSLDRLSFLEEGTTKENLQADLKAAELVFLRKAKPIMMRESRTSLMEAMRIAKTQEETVRTLKQSWKMPRTRIRTSSSQRPRQKCERLSGIFIRNWAPIAASLRIFVGTSPCAFVETVS